MYSPRIYTYKITFEEVPYYYYGVHKEKKFDEEYWGSPITNNWCWEIYTPSKQILQVFHFSDDGWNEAQEVEKRLIRPVYNTDKWCLNENCGGYFSLETCRKFGKVNGDKNVETGHIQELGKKTSKFNIENKRGIFAYTPEEKSEVCRKAGKKTYEIKKGCFSMTPEQRTAVSKKAGNRTKELGIGIFAITPEERTEISKKAGLTNKKNKTGIVNLSEEQLSQNCKKVNAQKWMCTETGFIANPGNLSHYQKSKGIDKSKRIRLE